MIKRLIIFSFFSAFTCITSVAQDTITISETEVDMPDGMMVTEEDLMNNYTNRENLSSGTENVRTLSYDDSIIVSRLSRIPTTIEMP